MSCESSSVIGSYAGLHTIPCVFTGLPAHPRTANRISCTRMIATTSLLLTLWRRVITRRYGDGGTRGSECHPDAHRTGRCSCHDRPSAAPYEWREPAASRLSHTDEPR